MATKSSRDPFYINLYPALQGINWVDNEHQTYGSVHRWAWLTEYDRDGVRAEVCLFHHVGPNWSRYGIEMRCGWPRAVFIENLDADPSTIGSLDLMHVALQASNSLFEAKFAELVAGKAELDEQYGLNANKKP